MQAVVGAIKAVVGAILLVVGAGRHSCGWCCTVVTISHIDYSSTDLALFLVLSTAMITLLLVTTMLDTVVGRLLFTKLLSLSLFRAGFKLGVHPDG